MPGGHGSASWARARLAAPGEALIAADAAAASDLDPDLERTIVALKGKELATEVVSVRIGPAGH